VNSNQIDIRKVRRNALIGSVILAIIGTLHLLKGHTKFYYFLYSLSAFLFVVGGFFPRIFKKITHIIGELITGFLLAVIFYIIITPFGLIMRIFGKDPLDKRIEKDRDSYWLDKDAVETNYEKQF